MINTLIFDFGDVFINLDKQGALSNALQLFKMDALDEAMITINTAYETGDISTQDFIAFYRKKFAHLNDEQIISAWNFIIKDFPKYRLEFIQQLAKKQSYQLILLSNTNSMHIDYIKNSVPFYDRFKSCFDAFYLSHEIHLRKPEREIFDFVIDENNLTPKNCLFIDDTAENTLAASQLGINVWNIDESKEDIIDLFKINAHLF